jgi:hypothetical protein
MTDSATTISISNCLGRTCMKWGADGELTANDLALVLERLAQVDGAVTAVNQSDWDQQPTPSVC